MKAYRVFVNLYGSSYSDAGMVFDCLDKAIQTANGTPIDTEFFPAETPHYVSVVATEHPCLEEWRGIERSNRLPARQVGVTVYTTLLRPIEVT